MNTKKSLLLNVSLVLLALCYYLFFLNKGLVIFDEGYTLHNAERIAQGQVPYYDFFLQYTPGFFYLIALSYKLFGPSIIIGRIVTVFIASGIVLLTLILLDEMRQSSFIFKIITVVVLVAFGFPLFNIPLVVWPGILITVALMLIFVKWSKTSFTKWRYPIYAGILLALLFFVKQNLGLAFIALLNIFILLSHFQSRDREIKSIVLMNTVLLLLTIPWVYYFFIRSSILSDFMSFNKRYFAMYPLSYPPLTFLLQPLGLFKLLPYYLPIIFLVLLCYAYINKKWDKAYILVSLMTLAGFAVTVTPTSDLVHVYPFLGLILVMFLVFLQARTVRFRMVYLGLIALTVLSGFYLTWFRKDYGYYAPYLLETTPLPLAKAKYITVDVKSAAEDISLNAYINSHTRKHEYIFVYPFAAGFYFLFDRPNPSRYSIYLPMYLTELEEKQTIADIQRKKVSLIVTAGEYRYPTPLSQWIQKHTMRVMDTHTGFSIFKVIGEQY